MEWAEIEAPWLEIDQYADILLDKIDFLDILDECGVEYWDCRSGEFTHRMKCPLPIHDFGGERTASMFLDTDKNKFYCFGCNSGGSVIDFISLYQGLAYYEAIEFLTKFVDISASDALNLPKRRRKDPEDMVETHVFRASVMLRDYLVSFKGTDKYNKMQIWTDKQFIKLDSYLNRGDEMCQKAREYCSKLSNHIKGTE